MTLQKTWMRTKTTPVPRSRRSLCWMAGAADRAAEDAAAPVAPLPPACSMQPEHGTSWVSTYQKDLYKEVKAKVVAAALGTELIRFLVALAILHQDE